MITVSRDAHLTHARDAIAASLEQEYEFHTERLAVLTATPPKGHRLHDERRAAQHAHAVAAVRNTLADVARALRRLAEGTYGQCELCLEDIPLDALQQAPATSRCPACVAF